MARKRVIWERLEIDREDGVISIPQNRTLYVDQFTDDVTSTTSENSPFVPKCMKDVFDFYKPRVIIDLEDGNENIVVTADFAFTDIKDFDDDHLVAQIQELMGKQDSLNLSNSNIQSWDCIVHNLRLVRDRVKKLEISYRSLSSFFDNTGQQKVDYLTLINVYKDDLSDILSDASKSVQFELASCYDRLDLRNNYSLLVIPGYLGDKDAVYNWAKVAFQNQVMLITDFKDCDTYEDMKFQLEKANLQGKDAIMGKVIMTCNYILGRKKYAKIEEDDLYIPGSAVLAGRMTNIEEFAISKPVVGNFFGSLHNVMGVHFNLHPNEMESLIEFGVVPLLEKQKEVYPIVEKTLYNGHVTALKEASFVRTIDWISKVFKSFINDQAHMMFDATTKANIKEAILCFLSDIKGPERLIESYNLISISWEKNKEIHLSVEIKPFSNEKTYLFELVGKRGICSYDWEQKVRN